MARTRWIGKTIGSLVVLGALGGAGWYYVYVARAEPPPKFQTVAVTRGSITQSITASGTLQPVLSVDVSSQVSGRIQEILVDFNAKVEKGQVLARMDPATFQAAVAQAENELLNARANLRLIRTETERSRILFEKNLVSKADLEKSEASLEQATSNVSIRESALESRKTDLGRCTIYAPIDGIVMGRNVNPGQTVSASTSAPTLFVIANDLSKMQISAQISEADVGSLKEELAVNFTVDAFPGRTFTGQVRQVRNSPKTVDSVVTYETIISVENPGGLKPGMTANVSIIIERRESTLRLANAALRVRLPEALQPPAPAAPAAPTGTAGAPAATPANGTPAPGATPAVATAADGSATPPAGGGAPTGANGERRNRRGQGGQGGGAGGGGDASGFRARMAAAGGERPMTMRVIYKVTGSDEKPTLEAVRVRTGISDSSFTEILGSVEEGDKFVTAVILPGAAAAAAARPGMTGPGGMPGMGGGGGGNRQFGGGGGGGRGF